MSKQLLEKLRTRFEQFAVKYISNGDNNFILRAKDGGYQNSRCESAWSDFRNAAGVNSKERRTLKEYSIAQNILGDDTLCIIGSHDEKKAIRCSTRPKVHRGGFAVRQEATRLAGLYPGKKFFVFAMMPEYFQTPVSRIKNLVDAGYTEEQAGFLDKAIDTIVAEKKPVLMINGQSFDPSAPSEYVNNFDELRNKTMQHAAEAAVEEIIQQHKE